MPEKLTPCVLHYELIHGLIDRGVCPTNAELAALLDTTATEIEQLLRSLADMHGVVLHPNRCEPWVVHPFSVTPTLNWVAGPRGGWWSPCVWCAFGVAVLAGGEIRIHTRFGAESEAVEIAVTDGEPISHKGAVVHFAIPAARAWGNVHEHCSLVLPFQSEAHIRKWCERHRRPFGEAAPLETVGRLARLWYGSHDQRNWHKWTVAEAREIFREARLTSDFWNLGGNTGRY